MNKPWVYISHNYLFKTTQISNLIIYNNSFEFNIFFHIIIHLIIIKKNNIAWVFANFISIDNINIGNQNIRVLTLYLIFLILIFFS